MSTSTKQAWTPGPWYASGNCVHFANGTEAEGNRSAGTICEVFARAERQRANAKLIAKAPEMAQVLQSLLGYLRGWFPDEPLFSAEPHSQAQVIADAERILSEAGVL